jgi:hypothetical protein
LTQLADKHSTDTLALQGCYLAVDNEGQTGLVVHVKKPFPSPSSPTCQTTPEVNSRADRAITQLI